MGPHMNPIMQQLAMMRGGAMTPSHQQPSPVPGRPQYLTGLEALRHMMMQGGGQQGQSMGLPHAISGYAAPGGSAGGYGYA